MENSLQVFDYNGSAVRTVNKDNEIWFVAKDVCDVLELGNITEALRNLDDDELSSEILKSGSQGREMRLINEAGLYALVFRSNKPEAKVFSRWVRHDVLPAIRRTGSYRIQNKQEVSASDAVNAAKTIFETAGIIGNQAALALDKVYRSYTGRSALEAGEITLTAPTKHQTLTPTEIGKHFGLKARRVNEILAGFGFQHRINDNWEPLKPGEDYAVMVDVGKRHSNGTAVRQLKWDSSILDVFGEFLNDNADFSEE